MNPEFRRYVWLELSPLRLWALPLVLLALVVVFNGIDGPAAGGISHEAMRTLGLGVFSVFAVWGAYKASQSVTSEVVGGTWDLQRLAGHRPWELLVGKLFGSTVYDWLGLPCGAALYAVGTWPKAGVGATVLDVVILMLGALALQAVALLASLAVAAGMRQTRRPSRSGGRGVLVGFVLVAFWVGPALFRVLSGAEEAVGVVRWWWTMSAPVFTALSLGLVIAWALTGAHRLVRAELQEPVSPLPWIGFLVFLTAYFVPFVPDVSARAPLGPLMPALAVGALMCGVFFHPLLLGERKDIVRVRDLAAAWSRGDARAVWTRLPLWVFNLLGYGLCVVGLAVSAAVWPSAAAVAVVGAALSFGWFMLRDLGWILAVHLAPGAARRPDLVVFFFLAVLYGLVPLVILAFGEAAKPALNLFVPIFPVAVAAEGQVLDSWVQSLWAVPGVAIAWALLVPRLRRALRPVPPPEPATAP